MMRQTPIFAAIVSLFCVTSISRSKAGVLYPPPAGGWTYEYSGDMASGGADFTALDGSWNHNNGSDEWDETTIGEPVAGKPGGVNGGLTDGSTVYARFQDTGDPGHYIVADPAGSKLFFGHDISAEGANATVLDDGVTVTFRARVSTGAPLDHLYHPAGVGIFPWPAGGIGYGTHNGAKGNFTIKQQAGGAIAFSLGLDETDGATNPTGALVMNNLNGNTINGDVDTGDPGTINEVALADPTDWQEFWINVVAGGTGTHRVSVYHDGSLTPTVYDVTAGDGSDFDGISYIAIGLGNAGRAGAVDVDFFAWSPGVITPVPEPSTMVMAFVALAGLAAAVRRSRS